MICTLKSSPHQVHTKAGVLSSSAVISNLIQTFVAFSFLFKRDKNITYGICI